LIAAPAAEFGHVATEVEQHRHGRSSRKTPPGPSESPTVWSMPAMDLDIALEHLQPADLIIITT
jgi:hypothetical protein